MNKKAVSMGWLYLLLFVLTVALMVVLVVPEQAWPNKNEFISKIGLDKLKMPTLLQPDDCPEFNEEKCNKHIDLGCYPSYSKKSNIFIECRDCPAFPTCQMVGSQEACEQEPCGLVCKWVTGQYEGGYTLNGKCIYADTLSQFKKELAALDMKYTYDFKGMNKLNETNQHSVYTSGSNLVIIDKISRTVYLEKNGMALAYDKNGIITPGLNDVSREIISFFRGELNEEN